MGADSQALCRSEDPSYVTDRTCRSGAQRKRYFSKTDFMSQLTLETRLGRFWRKRLSTVRAWRAMGPGPKTNHCSPGAGMLFFPGKE